MGHVERSGKNKAVAKDVDMSRHITSDLMESQDASKPDPVSFPQGSIAIPVQYQHQWKESQKIFLKVDTKALGVVQIMIAFMNLSLGLFFILFPEDSRRRRHFLWYTGYIFWGTAFFIISGSLSIAVEKRTTNVMVQSSLAMNIVSSVMAGLGIIFLSINLVTHIFLYYCRNEGSFYSCFILHSIFLGINVILLILAFLEFLVSIIISGFTCNVLCCGQSEVTILMPPSSSYVPENLVAEASKGGTMLQNPVVDTTTALTGSHPDGHV
ncbi:membrane-spanning 4-domains subfamily A member 4A-like [Gracilinanus agilis]|uniref:membrane-spanning 4-domains subfamily A member 4A-like n=1 Tax=Gracilinanus agilis TaxID=191870 RepID=UPI001CFC5277|nr:membrane-spanning 4-domains subfamily A member 4A-like [Gracilinanus agilis]